jgi:hypothetical protein
MNLFYISDFGGVPDGITDTTRAMAEAILAAAASCGPTEILLEEGAYLFDAPTAQQAAILLTGAQDLTITGVSGKTTFVITNPGIGTFLLQDCMNISLRGISVDYDPLPYTQGTIVAIDREGGTLDLAIDPGYPLPDEAYFAEANLRLGARGNLRGNETEYSRHTLLADTASLVRDRIYRIYTSLLNQFGESNNTYGKLVFAKDHLRVGDRFTYTALRYTQAAVCAWRSRNLSISEITVYAGPSIATMWALCDTVHISRLVIEIKPGTDRLLSANADGVHALGVRNGILMEHCRISGNGDDGVNIHARSGYVREVQSDTIIRIDPHGTSDYRVGDLLQLMERRKIRATVKVVSVSKEDTHQVVTFDPPVTGVIAGIENKDCDRVINLSECCQGSVFRHNVFGIGHGRSMLLSSHDILVENNYFKNINGWAINLSFDANYGEGPQPYKVTVRNNTFKGVGCSRMPTLFFHAVTPWSGSTVPGDHPIRDILVEHNTFVHPRNTLLSADGVAGLAFLDNRILLDDSYSVATAPLMKLTNSHDIRIRDVILDGVDNIVVDERPFIKITSDVEPGEQGVSIRDTFTADRGATIRILDEREQQRDNNNP